MHSFQHQPTSEAVPSVENASKLPGSPPGRLPVVVVCLFLALAVFVVFGQTLRHDFVNYDDDVYVYENPAVTKGLSLGGIAGAFARAHGSNWHPLTTISHMADCQLYGLKPGGHHLTNVLLHTATVLLLFLLLRNLTGAFWPSAFVAAVFGLHPLRVESVAWVAERKDVLSGLFFVLTLGAYFRYARRLAAMNFSLTLGLFTLALLSKPMVVTLPFILLLLDYWPLGRWRWHSQTTTESKPPVDHQGQDPQMFRRLIIEKIPFLLLGAAAGLATILAQQGAIKEVQNLGFLPRIENALVAYVVYLWQLLYPNGLAVYYPHPKDQMPFWLVGLCVVILTIISAGVLRWQRNRPYLLVGWLWYLGMLVPVIGILQVGSQAHADRYTYLPQIGLSVLMAWGAVDLCGVWRCHRIVLGTAAAMVLTSLMILASIQTSHWRDSVSLWKHTIDCTPENSRTQNNFGVALAQQGKWDEAIHHYEQALRLKPDYAKALYNMGNALAARGKNDDAIQSYERALQFKPDHAETHYVLGVALAAQGRYNEAIRHYQRVIGIKPDNFQAHNNLGSALAARGEVDEAIRSYERALQINPALAETHANLGNRLAEQGKFPEAKRHFQHALQLATSQGNPALAEAIRTRFESYRSNSPRTNTP